jgi:hypothetical protein
MAGTTLLHLPRLVSLSPLTLTSSSSSTRSDSTRSPRPSRPIPASRPSRPMPLSTKDPCHESDSIDPAAPPSCRPLPRR